MDFARQQEILLVQCQSPVFQRVSGHFVCLQVMNLSWQDLSECHTKRPKLEIHHNWLGLWFGSKVPPTWFLQKFADKSCTTYITNICDGIYKFSWSSRAQNIGILPLHKANEISIKDKSMKQLVSGEKKEKIRYSYGRILSKRCRGNADWNTCFCCALIHCLMMWSASKW